MSFTAEAHLIVFLYAYHHFKLFIFMSLSSTRQGFLSSFDFYCFQIIESEFILRSL